MARVLCIEDDPRQREEILDVLATEGFETLEAYDGTSGFASIVEEKPDLILCDRVMEGISGYALLALIRQTYPALDKIPFLFVTALDDRRDELGGVDFHPTDYIKKPIDFDELVGKIRQLTSQITSSSQSHDG